MPTTWSTTDKGANVTISNGKSTALVDSFDSVRSTTSKTSGKWYFECRNKWVTIKDDGGDAAVGILSASGNIDAMVGEDAFGWGIYWRTGVSAYDLMNNGNDTVLIGPGVDGDIIGICVDLDSLKLYATRNGTNLLGNPAAGTGGQTIASGTWFAAAGGNSNTLPSHVGVNFGPSVAYGPPTGFSTWDAPTATTWNSSDKGANVILSNGDLTATLPVPGSEAVRSTTLKTRGRWYFEVIANWTNTFDNIPGIMTDFSTINGSPGQDDRGYGLFYEEGANDWFLFFDNGSVNLSGAAVDGDVIGVCLDLDSNRLYFTQNGANLLGNPSAGTGGQDISFVAVGVANNWYAAVGGGGASTTDVTANFGATAFAFDPPSGFTAWDSLASSISVFDISTPFFTHIRQVVGV